MASVTFAYGAFMHDADDLTDFVYFARRGPSAERNPQGAVYITAAGTRRWTQSPGVNESFQVQTRTTDAVVAEWLYRRDGDLALYKDKRGRMEFGIITNLNVGDMDSNVYEISLTFTPIDHDPDPVDASM